jgi:hypothetical protein
MRVSTIPSPKERFSGQPSSRTNRTIQGLRLLRSAALRGEPDSEKVGRILDFEAELAAQEAKSAFDADFSQLQTELPNIEEKGVMLSNFGRKVTTYARWEDINRVIKPILSRRGFSLRFKTGHDGERVMVTCGLHHVAGHVEEATLRLPVEVSGGKNAVQAIGSSTSYGKRYTASALLNLTSSGEDDDGAGGEQTRRISGQQVRELRALLGKVGASETRLKTLLSINTLEDLPAHQLRNAVAALSAKGQRA